MPDAVAMPIVTFHLVDGLHSEGALRRLLVESSELYARVLDSPLDRVRAVVDSRPAAHVAVGGVPVAEVPVSAPSFEFLLLAGRPEQQRRDLLAGFTDLLVDVLGVRRDLVRGRAVEVDPGSWAIGGVPAGERRASEIAARAEAGAP